MKKFKKVFAVLLTLAMVLGMSMTTFAAPTTSYASEIKVTGLSSQEAETVNLYKAITLNADKNAWVIEDWAQPYIELSADGKEYVIKDAAGLTAHVSGTPISQQHVVDATEVTFSNVPVGAYVVTATGTKITYAPMVAETYVEGERYMQAENVTLVAKATGYDLDKTANDHFVKRGGSVEFTITTTFPSFEVANSDDNSFTIVDTPIKGLDITGVTEVKVGGADVTTQCTTSEAQSGAFTIDLSALIGTTNANAGKTVVVKYTAVVTEDDGYENTANAYRNNVNMGVDGEEGFTGDITLTKYAENGTTVLQGAEFKLYKGTKDNKGTALSFVQKSEGVYKLAMSTDINTTQTLVATNGTVKVTGLDEGDYWFEETKAPEGYSINVDGASKHVDASETANVSLTTSLKDTKLAALPGTGGIGTTIFTIGGCLIMIIAAALFFANRRKAK